MHLAAAGQPLYLRPISSSEDKRVTKISLANALWSKEQYCK